MLPPLLFRKSERRSQVKPPPASGRVDPLELRIGPFHCVLGRHALHSLSVHVGDEVLAQAFGRFAVGGTGIAWETAGTGRRLERQHHGVLIPERVLLPDKANFELWSFAVSSINGCSHCMVAHEHTLREAGVDREAILEALKVAAIVSGVAQAITTAQILAAAG